MSSSKKDSPDEIPPGYSLITAPNGQQYLVPTFMVHATQTALEVEVNRKALKVDNAEPGVILFYLRLRMIFQDLFIFILAMGIKKPSMARVSQG